MDNNKPIPIDALFDEGMSPNLSSDPRKAFNDANVIIGHDWMTGNEFVVFGRQKLEKIAISGETEMCRFLRIGLDQDTDDLEKLIALVTVIKGSHDYLASGESSPKQLTKQLPTVRVQDPETNQIVTIPITELAPGMLRVNMVGVGKCSSTPRKDETLRPSGMGHCRKTFVLLSQTFTRPSPASMT